MSNNYTKAYQALNDKQREAVDTIDGPVLVIAGPGTGKTQLLSLRVANILQKQDIDANNILCLTFTDSASENMRERLMSLIGPTSSHVAVHTFHSFGSEIIHSYPEYFADAPIVQHIDDLKIYEILYDIFDELPHINPFSTKVADDYLHIKSTINTIGWSQKAGLMPEDLTKDIKDNLVFIDSANKLVGPVFTISPSKKQVDQYENLYKELTNLDDTHLKEMMCDELRLAIDSLEPNKAHAKPITSWRNKWLSQDTYKNWQCADKKRLNYLQAFADIYQKFDTVLKKNGWYTYEDMILRSKKALEQNESLRLTLQEKYQYILVDEYQDTNGAQEKLLNLLADHPVHEGKPNLMVVGDDDQAIYRFQGAHTSIMLQFAKQWKGVKQVVLKDNYRSTDKVLTLARNVILQGEDRLENIWPEINKELSPKSSHNQGQIQKIQAVDQQSQNQHIAQHIKQLLREGTAPNQIAILAPKHAYLKSLVPYLLANDIPISYEKRENILEQPFVLELINFCKLLHSADKNQWGKTNGYFPAVLSAPYWQIAPITLAKLSLQSYADSKLWIESLLEHIDTNLQKIGEAISVLANTAHHQPFEILLDQILGNTPIKIAENQQFSVPFKSYYLDEQSLENNPASSLSVVRQLTILRDRFREYRPGKLLTLSDFLDFVSALQRSGLTLLDTSTFSTDNNSVQILTAYKAKGQEWDYVFAIDAHDTTWGIRARGGNESFVLPTYLQYIKPPRDTADDKLRLFYVALTRARHTIFLTSYTLDKKGKQNQDISWLQSDEDWVPETTNLPPSTQNQEIKSLQISWQDKVLATSGNLRTELQPLLDSYKLSPTHLNSFMNIPRGGPSNFLTNNLLRFPSTISPSSCFGQAIHEALHNTHLKVINNKPINPAKVIAIFETKLKSYPLELHDQKRLIARGRDVLSGYLTRSDIFNADDKSEKDFSREGAQINGAKLTGKIDVLRKISSSELEVIDYKTGRALNSWKGLNSDHLRTKAYNYKHQLLFYKLLVENSASFSKHFTVTKGTLCFVEPNEDGQFVNLEIDYTNEDMDNFQKLINVVWSKITTLDFPDTSKYSQDYKGILAFEQDLINHKI